LTPEVLDILRPTATGLDKLMTWFLRLTAPVLCSPVANLINTSLLTLTVPNHWKQVRIRPVRKTPDTTADCRPSTYPSHRCFPTLLSELWSGVNYIYLALLSPPPSLQFADQFAFRPAGSATAAIIAVLNIVINQLSSEPTSSSSHWTFLRFSTLYVIHHCSVNLHIA